MTFTPIDTSKSWSYQCCYIESCFPRLQRIDADVHSIPAWEKMKFDVCSRVMLDFMFLRSKPRGKCFSWDFQGVVLGETGYFIFFCKRQHHSSIKQTHSQQIGIAQNFKSSGCLVHSVSGWSPFCNSKFKNRNWWTPKPSSTGPAYTLKSA